MSSTCFSQSPVPLALLLTVAAAQCKENSLSLYTNTKTKANISIAVSPSALHNNTSTQSKHKSQRVVSQPLQTNYSGVYSYRRCMAVRYMQTMSKKERVANRNAQTEGKVPVVFSSPIYWLRIPRSEARSQAMCWSYAALADMYAPGSGRRQQS